MKKLFVLIFVTANLAAMDHTNSRMALSFILNSESVPAFPAIDRDFLVGQKHPRPSLDGIEQHATLQNKRTRTEEKSYKCPYSGCEYATSHSGNFKAHLRAHAGEKPFKCTWPDCQYASAYRSNLTQHRYIHTGEKPFKCPYPNCPYAAAQKGSVTIHMRSAHTGEKPYKCEYPGCSYAATTHTRLQKHLHAHTNKRSHGTI